MQHLEKHFSQWCVQRDTTGTINVVKACNLESEHQRIIWRILELSPVIFSD